jgi:RNA 2',3'-cyclic 3'-phosphodiesterase
MAHGATARLFAAVDPPAAVREALAAWARESGATLRTGATKVRLLAPETMHLTLCFLGARPVAEIELLASALERCAAPEVGPVSLGAPLWLPPREPRSLALELGDPEGGLAALQEVVSEAFAGAIEWEPERRRFRAHVTVVRVRGGSRRRRDGRGGLDSAAIAAAALPATPRLQFLPETMTLYRSLLDPAGARYEALASCRLLPADSG